MILDALASVIQQDGVAYEHIVVDGGSRDNSIAVAENAGARVIAAPGSSIYEAINIGLTEARGRFICLLNTDDWLRPGSLIAAEAAFEAQPELDLVRGRATVEARVGDRWVEAVPIAEPTTLNLRSALLGRANINACIFKRELIKRVGLFDPIYAISADREWLTRVLLSGAAIGGLDEDIYVYRSHAGSLTIGRGRVATEKWLREHLSFSCNFMHQPSLAATDRRILRQFHAKETVHLALRALLRFGIDDFLDVTVSSFKTNPFWPMRAILPVGAILARRLAIGLPQTLGRLSLRRR